MLGIKQDTRGVENHEHHHQHLKSPRHNKRISFLTTVDLFSEASKGRNTYLCSYMGS